MTYRRAAFRRIRVGAGDVPDDVDGWLRGSNDEPWPWVTLIAAFHDQLERHWARARDQIMADFLAALPGRRPRGWWCFDAPEPLRLRLGGTGDQQHPRTIDKAVWHTTECGLPKFWITRTTARIYRGKGIDPDDPPIFESQPAYLERHRIFHPGEKEVVPPAAFQPSAISVDEKGTLSGWR